MENMSLQEYQIRATDSIRRAIEKDQKRIVIDIPSGCGIGVVVAETVELISRMRPGKILILTCDLILKEQAEKFLQVHTHVTQGSSGRVLVEAVQRFEKYSRLHMPEYKYILFYDVPLTENIYSIFYDKRRTLVVFSVGGAFTRTKLPAAFRSDDVVFSYSLKRAVYDGVVTPAMGNGILEYAIENYLEHLLKQFGCKLIEFHDNSQNQWWDLVIQKGDRRIWVEYKLYKSQVVPPSLASSLLNKIVARKVKQGIPKEDLVMLIVFNNAPGLQKNEIYEKYGIVIWDIENLVFYSGKDSILLKQLTQITYFSIDHIEGCPSDEARMLGFLAFSDENSIVSKAEKESSKSDELIRHLRACKPGPEYSADYECLCETIVRLLFEANYFNKLSAQHKTHDKHFRMDLIGSLKVSQSNEGSMHPLWDMLIRHFNSHFIVFEFKNYTEEIDQDLIYITEKYLFDAALRNVAIIISRKGFSKSARFAAEGCLKEHGKLILDVSDADLERMLEEKDGEAADYLLGKMEDFLMGISKWMLQFVNGKAPERKAQFP